MLVRLFLQDQISHDFRLRGRPSRPPKRVSFLEVSWLGKPSVQLLACQIVVDDFETQAHGGAATCFQVSATLGATRDPWHEEHEPMLEWVGGSFDQEGFDLALVNRGSATLSHKLQRVP